MIDLYGVPASLYTAKTRIVLRAKAAPWRDRSPPGGYGSDAYRRIVPSGTLPAIDHDGFILAESEAINEYLNEIYPLPSMLPEDVRLRAIARAHSRFHDTRLEPALRALFAHVAPSRRNAAIVATQADLLSRRLEELAEMADPSPLLCGEGLSLADCGFAISFSLMRQLSAAMDFPIAWPPAITAYEMALEQQPAVRDELAQYRQSIVQWLVSTGAATGAA